MDWSELVIIMDDEHTYHTGGIRKAQMTTEGGQN